MIVPKVTGIETEYGILLRGVDPSDPVLASQLLLQYYQNVFPRLPIAISQSQTIPVKSFDLSSESIIYDLLKSLVQSVEIDVTKPVPDSFMLANGGRFYIDHAHPEYCTAEAFLPRQIVAADKAGEAILELCRQRVNLSNSLPSGCEISIYKNNSDQKGNSYGCHENYLLSTATYKELIEHQSPRAKEHLISFLITRTIFCGAGKVGSEHGTDSVGFQISQRADFFETLYGLQTTHNRPLINTRNEPHANAEEFRRLHVIVGDANMSEYSTYLKVGTTQLLLTMLEEEALDFSLAIADPIAAFKTISRDLTLQCPILLANGSHMTALEMQQHYLYAAQHYLQQGDHPEYLHEVAQIWQDILERLSHDWRSLNRTLDWAIKRQVLEQYLQRQNCDWDTVLQWEPIIRQTLFLDREVIGEQSSDLFAAIQSRLGKTVAQEFLEIAASEPADQSHPSQRYWQQRDIYFTLRQIDLKYHDIQGLQVLDIIPSVSGSAGLFYRLQQGGMIQRLLTDAEIAPLISEPPADTRAYLRSHCINRYPELIADIDWGKIEFIEAERRYCLMMDDPTFGSQISIEKLIDASPDLLTLLQGLAKMS
jgi:Pup amidohydrolase